MAKGMSDVPVFPVILLAGLTVFGLVFIASQTTLNLEDENQNRKRAVFTSHSFGKVGRANQDFRTINFGDFTVGETRGNILAYSKRKKEISNSLLGGQQIKIKYNATQPRGGKITFEVLGRSGNGQVYTKINGQTFFQEHLIASGTPEIKIPSKPLKPGINTIIIGTTQGGILSSSKYALEDIEVRINDRKFHDFKDSFQVYDYELKDFVKSQLTFSIRSSIKNQPLQVYINDNRIYSKKQVRVSPEKINVDPGKTGLHPGYNSIRFETDGQSEYTIENAQLTLRYLGNTERRTIKLNFRANKSSLEFASQENTKEKIRFQYQRLLPSPRVMQIELNNKTRQIQPKNGLNNIKIKASELKRENTLYIRSNATYQINNLQVISHIEEKKYG